jgi:hypothetical protein
MLKRYTPTSAAVDVEAALRLLEGRWKLVILFHLFGRKVMRFSDLERAMERHAEDARPTTSAAWKQTALCTAPPTRRFRRKLNIALLPGRSLCVPRSMPS